MNITPEEVASMIGAVGQVLSFISRISAEAGRTWTEQEIAAVRQTTQALHDRIAMDLRNGSAAAGVSSPVMS